MTNIFKYVQRTIYLPPQKFKSATINADLNANLQDLGRQNQFRGSTFKIFLRTFPQTHF